MVVRKHRIEMPPVAADSLAQGSLERLPGPAPDAVLGIRRDISSVDDAEGGPQRSASCIGWPALRGMTCIAVADCRERGAFFHQCLVEACRCGALADRNRRAPTIGNERRDHHPCQHQSRNDVSYPHGMNSPTSSHRLGRHSPCKFRPRGPDAAWNCEGRGGSHRGIHLTDHSNCSERALRHSALTRCVASGKAEAEPCW